MEKPRYLIKIWVFVRIKGIVHKAIKSFLVVDRVNELYIDGVLIVK